MLRLSALLLSSAVLSAQVVIGSQEQDRAGQGVVVIDGPQEATPGCDAELAQLKSRVAALEAERGAAAGEAHALALAPWLAEVELAVYGNLVGRADSKRLVNEDGDDIDDRVRLRQVAFDLHADLGQDARMVLLLAWSADPVNEFDADVEEGYLELIGIPLLPDWTRRVRFKGGRFRSSFGRSNELLLFEIPQITRPLPVQRLLGENGFVPSGLAAQSDFAWGERHEVRLTYELLDHGDLPGSQTSGDEGFADLVDVDWRVATGARSSITLGTSGYVGKQSGLSGEVLHLYGLDALFALAAPEGAGRGAFWLGLEHIRADIERPGPAEEPVGTSLWSQYRFLEDWSAGVRFDTVEELTDDSLETRQLGFYLTYAPRSDMRIAFGWEHTESDLDERDGADAILVEGNFALGAGSGRPSRPWLLR